MTHHEEQTYAGNMAEYVILLYCSPPSKHIHRLWRTYRCTQTFK